MMDTKRFSFRRGGSVLGVLAALAVGQMAGAEVISFVIDQKLSSDSTDVSVKVTLDDESVAGSVKFTLEVNSGNIGDMRGLFFHVTDASLLAGLSVSGADVTDHQFSENNVINLGGGANMQGGGTGSPAPFDGGVEIGSSGIGGDDIQSTMLVLSHDTEVITNALFSQQVLGVRLTSVGPAGDRSGSSKIIGIAPTLPTSPGVPEPAMASLWLAGIGLAVMTGRGWRG